MSRTPGPWFACAWDPMERPHVTTVREGLCKGNQDLPRTVADAHLMAAAPELLEACNALMAEWDDGRFEWVENRPDILLGKALQPPTGGELFDVLRAAIAKAESSVAQP